jgi:hypothetical protein
LIYNAADTLAGLGRRPGFRYEPGVVVDRFEEAGSRVRLHVTALGSAEERTVEAARVFLACGSVSTPRLVLRSLDLYDRPVELEDSQYFLLPLLRARRVPGVADEALHTLSQAFLELDDPLYEGTSVHLQVYSYNDLVPDALRGAMGPLARLGGPLVERMVGRVLIVQGYLHSRLSPGIRATLRHGSTGEPRLVLTSRPNPASARLVKAVGRMLLRSAGSLRAEPGELECDARGRLAGHQRVHIVDASALPSIPATTITLTVMANAHRIGSLVDAD